MALSGTFNSTAYGNNTKVQLQCSWSATQNIEGNYSLITVTAYLSFYSLEVSGRTGSITIDGNKASYSVDAIDDYDGKTIMIRSDYRVDHNSDGTKTINLSASYPLRAEYSGVWVDTLVASANNISLDTIPRASEIVSIGSFNIEELFALVTDKKVDSFTDKLTIKLGDEVIKVVDDYESEVGIEFTDDEQLTLYNLIDDWSDTLTFLLETYNGGTLIGSDTATETVTIKGDVTYHTSNADKGATFYVGTANGVKRCITYDGTKRTYR